MDMSGASISTQVVVVGTGWTGHIVANEIADFGFRVLLVQGNESGERREGPEYVYGPRLVPQQELHTLNTQLHQREGVRFLPEARLTECRGSLGNFSLRLEAGTQALQESAGAVVLATEMRSISLFASYGLTEAPNAVSLSGLEHMLLTDSNGKGEASSLRHAHQIAFLSGFAQEGDHLNQRRILSSLQALEEKGCQTYVYTRNLKVADDGLEELAKTDRQLGAIFFKLDECPDISPDGDQIRHHDPVLERQVLLGPDLIVLEEKFLPSPDNPRLAGLLNISRTEKGFLQEENIHRLPVHTNRRGIYSVGSAREIMTPSQTRSDASNAALVLKDDFQALRENLFGSNTFIDEDKCCQCLTCYRLCPHGAISLEDRPVISSLACQGCGLCASQCPQEAISVLDNPLEKSAPSQETSRKSPQDSTHVPRIIAYCCRNSAYEAGMAAYALNRELPSGLEIVEVPCAGSIHRDLILGSLQEGADGLLLLGCHSGACKSTRGNTYAGHLSQRLGAILEEVGLSGERIRFRTLAENMDAEFCRYTLEMEERLTQLGRNPLT